MINFSRHLRNRTIPSVFASCGTMIAVFPIAVWAHDSLFSLCRVRGSSMEPTLFHGDIVVVRKSDGFWQHWTRSFDKATIERKEGNYEHERTTDNNQWAVERERVLAFEREHCNSNGAIGLLRKPATPITGDIVVFKDPEKYPDRWNIKRVVALGGQIMRTSYVPPYCIWVEGDNPKNSIDSRSKFHGPVSKKLLVGIAEYRLWPPWRVGKLENSNSSDKKSPVRGEQHGD
eukprot:jgi/Psemu1/208220/e_gw1.462.10.1